jgi:hypothetical protein
MPYLKKFMGMPNSSIMNELYNIPNDPQEVVEEEIYIEEDED